MAEIEEKRQLMIWEWKRKKEERDSKGIIIIMKKDEETENCKKEDGKMRGKENIMKESLRKVGKGKRERQKKEIVGRGT